MPDYLSPGVYIEEIEGAAPIEGVSTSTAAFIGMAERGPVNVPILCTSPGDYARWFGGLLNRDDFVDPVDPHRSHCYLPYAVQGFFANGGQRAYVTRILPDEANNAWRDLYDRTGASPIASVLVRSAPEGSGLAADPLIMLGPVPPAPDTIRIGDGSVSEYLAIAATVAVADLVAIDLPLQLGHAAATPIASYARALHAGAAGPHTLTAHVAAGDRTILLNSPDALDGLADWVIELAAGGIAAIVVPTVATPVGVNAFSVTLTQPAPFAFSAAAGATVVSILDSTGVAAPALDQAATGGDTLLLASGGAMPAGNLLDIDPANAATREIRTIGGLVELGFTQPASVDWPARTLLSPVTLTAAAATSLTAAAGPGARVLSLASRTNVNPGTVLRLGAGPAREYAVVLAVQGARALGADPGGVVLDEGLVGTYANGGAVVPNTVDAAAPAGRRASQLVLATPGGSADAIVTWAAGWAAGDIVRIALPDGTTAFNTLGGAPAAMALESVTLAAPVQRTHPVGAPVVARDPLFEVRALDAGAWGRRIAVSVEDEDVGLVSRAEIAMLVGPTQLRLTTLTGIEPGSYLEMIDPTTGAVIDAAAPLKVRTVERSTTTIRLDTAISAAQTNAIGVAVLPIRLRSREFQLTVYLYRRPDPAVPSRNTQVIATEVFRNLSMDHRHSRYFQTVIGAINGPPRLTDRRPEGESWLIRTQDAAPDANAMEAPRLGPEPLVDHLPNGLVRPARHTLDQDGDDSLGTVADQTYIGLDNTEPLNRTGLFTLLNVPQISIVAIPGQGSGLIQAALIDHCENAQYRFAVLDPAHADAGLADIQAQRQAFDTKYAAIYYPWLTIPDPMPANLATIADFPLPPSGHVVGVYARVDQERGVHKAPANEVVQGITGLTRTLAKGEQDILNPSPTNINVIRDFRHDGRGIRVWGARCITSDTEFKYVPVRRLLIFLEQSLYQGLQTMVFEPNAPPLWAKVERVIGNFLTDVWRSGALEGTKPEQGFFVRCDRTTMTQTDIDNGRLIALVGVAPVKPAEFVIIQIGLWTAGSDQ